MDGPSGGAKDRLMIESDVLYAHIKESDWLKAPAETLLKAVHEGEARNFYAGREVLHELYYLLSRSGQRPEEALSKVGALTRIGNLTWTSTSTDNDLLALSLVATYRLSSIFDAYRAAACLLHDPDHTMVSTDSVYDEILGLKRVDPRDLAERLLDKGTETSERR